MTPSERRRLADVALSAAREASSVVMAIYGSEFQVEYKEADDPVTRADRQSNSLLCERLAQALPGVPIVAEESDPREYAGFAEQAAAWFVDPLDGTREFVARNGEFAVMVGLAENGRATLGVVVAPAWGRAFVGIVGDGAYEVGPDDSRAALRVSARDRLSGSRLLVSRTRTQAAIPALVAATRASQTVRHGSCGLKAALVATGAYDAYPQPGRAGMRWDACAADALVRAAGGECTDSFGAAFEYGNGSSELVNRQGLVITNAAVHAELLAVLGTPALLRASDE